VRLTLIFGKVDVTVAAVAEPLDILMQAMISSPSLSSQVAQVWTGGGLQQLEYQQQPFVATAANKNQAMDVGGSICSCESL